MMDIETPDHRKILVSIILGLAGFIGTFFAISASFPPHKITIIWSLFLPMLASLAYGLRYALVAVTLGGAGFFPFFLWPENGWFDVVEVILFMAWFLWHGYCAERRRVRLSIWNNLYVAQILFSVFYSVLFLAACPCFFGLNPPFWNPAASMSMPMNVIKSILLKESVMQFLQIFLCDMLLNLPPIRRAFSLPSPKAARYNLAILTSAVLLGAVVRLGYLAVETVMAGHDLAGMLAHAASGESIRVMMSIVILSLVAGLQLAKYVERRIAAEDELELARKRIQGQHAVVAGIAVSLELVSGDIRGLAVKIDELAAKALGVERVGVWLFDNTEDELVCVDLYEDSVDRHTAGDVLRRHEYENEFEALRTARYVDAHDPLTDPRTAGYVEGYLKPLHISSMLDAVIRESGRNLGVICFEHVEQAHHWQPDEIAFACQIADQIAIALMNRERKQAAEALRESESRYRTMIDSARDVVFLIDPQGKLISLNPAFETVTGLAMNEWLGRSFVELLHPDDLRNALKRMQSVLNGEQSGYFEYRIRTGRGDYVIAEIQGFPMVEKGMVTGVVGFARDVTLSRKLEQQLMQAQKMEAIGTLAGGIAHDFNNILAPIIGYAEMSRMLVKDNPRLTEYLGYVSDAATRATDLVRQILTFSRKAEQKKMPLQVSSVVNEALKLLRSSIPTSIEIRQKITADTLVLADPTCIHQIVMNLCTNAYHAMEPTGGILAVSLKEVEIPQEQIMGDEIMPGRYVVLDVSDTGCGMDKETREKIFDPYFTTKEKGKGTGLGLAVVHGIVKDHQGRITVYSETGRGSTFRVYLPVAEGAATVMSEGRKDAEPSERHEHILFVEDEERIRSMAKEYLTGYGYVVEVCANAGDALFAFEQDPDSYDLLITDMTMPGMNGKELAKRLMALRPDLPVILCTGYSSLIDREESARAGIKDYVEKPVVLSDLLVRIKRVMGDGGITAAIPNGGS